MKRFEQQLKNDAETINRHLLAIADTLVNTDRDDRVPLRLSGAMRHALLGGGKRFRPFLTLETTRFLGGDPAIALDAAAAIECLHCYSLVHDDLPAMDNDVLRRGLPTVHVAFGEATAILAGDALQTLAFELMSRRSDAIDAASSLALVHGLARASGAAGMAGGQQLDMEAEAAATPLTLEELALLHGKKTGALIAFAVDAGAIIGRASDVERRVLATYARAVGIAFQIADDLLDAEGSVEDLGKTPGKDQASAKTTFVSLLGADGARRRLAEVEADAISALEGLDRSRLRGNPATLADAARYAARRRN